MLVAVSTSFEDAFVATVSKVWEAGHAIFPLDDRLPKASAQSLLDRVGADVLWAADGSELASFERRRDPLNSNIGLIIATGGSSGEPKPIALTLQSLRYHAEMVEQRLDTSPQDVWLACLPFSHIGGFGVVARSILSGRKVIVNRFDPTEIAALGLARTATLTALVPTAIDRVDIGGFRKVLLGGAADFGVLRPPNVVRTYGMTETCGGVVYDGVTLLGVEVRDVDGTLHIASESLAEGVLQSDGSVEDIAVTFSDSPRRWLATSDAGIVQPNGSVEILGRIDDVIVSGGEKIWPAALEAAISTHPQVSSVAVAGIDDPIWGQRVVAWIVPFNPADPPSIDTLHSHLAPILPRYSNPKEVIVIEEMLTNAAGKVDRRRLRDSIKPKILPTADPL